MTGNPLLIACVGMLVAATAMKDVVFIGNGFYLREISQAICLVIGLYFLPLAAPRAGARLLLVLCAYLMALVIGMTNSSDWDFVGLQIISLASVLLFSVALWNLNPTATEANYAAFFRLTFYVLLVVDLASLVSILVAPGSAYEELYGGEVRFRGILSKAGWMGAAGGLLAGLALFGTSSFRAVRVVGFFVGVACLMLAGARTFWVAFAIAAIAGCVLYLSPARRRFGLAMGGIGAALIAVLWLHASVDNGELSKLTRFNSISTLTGRTTIWREAIEAAGERPWFGYGLSQGSAALNGGAPNQSLFPLQWSDPRLTSRVTLHSGYLQSLLDAGIIGTFWYGLLLLAALWRILWKDRVRAYPAAFFCLVFMMIGNISENVVYAASTLQSVLFWLVCVFALSVPMTASRMPASFARQARGGGATHFAAQRSGLLPGRARDARPVSRFGRG